MKTTQKISLLAAVAAVALCGGSAYADSPKAPIAKHVVLIGVDGFGARWIPWDKMPNLRALRDGGLYATGRDSYPTSSAINWATAFFGTVVEVHGYRNWNSAKPDIPPPPAALEGGRLPCVFSEIRRQDPSAYTATLFTWDGIGRCQNTNAASFARHFPGPGRDAYPPRDKSVSLGHGYGWGSEKFTNACVRVDENIGRIVEGVKKAGMWDDTVFMLVADHGGEGTKHGLANLNCFEIPFVVSGAPVKGKRLVEPVLLADTAPTILSILGYEVPDAMRGRNALR